MITKQLNIIVSKLKGEEFKIDESTPFVYLVKFFLSKFISLLYGIFVLKTCKRVFVHPSSTIKCRSRISFWEKFLHRKKLLYRCSFKRGLSMWK